ncbi:MAG: hypothetical protein IAF38_17360 [Bacteroidia bacterium]|nr:hypothetical protein [Bacteroidia bacterium]
MTLLFQIIFTYPFYLTVFCLLGGFIFAFVLYYKSTKTKDVSTGVARFLLALRLLFITLLAFFLLEPMLKNVSIEKEKPLLLIAIDNSQSILQNKDSAKIKKEFIEGLGAMGEELTEKFELKYYNFDHELRAGKEVNFKGKETDFSGIFNEIENNYSNRNLGALVIATDGLYNKGQNPLYSNKDLKYPVYSIALGDTTETKDLLVKKINHNQVAYLGNKFPADIIIEGKKVKGTKAVLSIMNNGKKVGEQKLDVNADSYLQTFSFIFDADKPGAQKYNVFVTYAEGEENKQNNSSSFVVEVIDNREKILILAEAPHPDIAAMKQSIEVNQNYEVEVALANEFNGSLKPYSLVIVHMLKWSTGLGKAKLEIESNNIPYLLISGNSTDNFPGLKINGPSGKTNDSEPIANKSFSLFSISDELKAYMKNFPALKSPLGNYQPGNDMNALIYQRIGVVETENPMLYFTFNSQQKAAVILGDGIWRWRLRDYADHGNFNMFNELMNKTIQYLSVKEDKSFFRLFTKKLFSENENIEMDAEVYNASYELIKDPQVSIEIKNEAGESNTSTFSNANGCHLNIGSRKPGQYTYEAKVTVNKVLFSKKGSFTVKELVAERINTVADHQLLYNLSRQTGGKLFYPNQLQKLKEELLNKEDIKTVSYEEKRLRDLIDFKWIFFVLLAFLSTEWFIRKRNGLY